MAYPAKTTRWMGVWLLLAAWLAMGAAWADRPAISEQPGPRPGVGVLPADGSTPQVNPPPFAWPPQQDAVEYVVEIASDRAFRPAGTLRIEGIRYSLYTHTRPLRPGWHCWRYAYRTSDGLTSRWSPVRTLHVSDQAVRFPRPPTAVATERLPAEHPRLLLRPEEVWRLRRATRGPLHDRWVRLRTRAIAALGLELTPEPPPFTDGQWNAAEWRRNYASARNAAQTAELLAFAYLISGDETYAARARYWLLHIASWDPAGSTSMRVNDEAGMPILFLTSRAYSWIHDTLTEPEREALQAMVRARGGEAFARLTNSHYEQYAYSSHAGRMWHFLAEAAIAYYGEVPEAERWLDYALTIFWGWYPVWGDSEGGWSEGLAYWNSYMNRVTWWLDVLRSATGIEGARKPFFGRTGDFPLYFAPPHGPVSGFGDYAERAAPAGGASVVNYLADAVGNPAWKWYAQQWDRAEYADTPVGFLRAARATPVPAAPPADLPQARAFRGVGWVALHTHLEDAARNVQLHFRASPFGNISHAHSDQNAIVLGAYGEPLLVNTGLRPWYGSPFCKQWYWTTQAHNAVLVGGEGQPKTREAEGRITAFVDNGEWAFVEGDAGEAYPNARQVVRRILFLRPDVFVIHDHIETERPLKCQWMMHARSPFAVADAQPCVTLTHGKAALLAQFEAPDGVTISQTDKYPLEPEVTRKPPPEWHLTAESPSPATAHDFVVILAVTHAGEAYPVSAVEPTTGLGIRFRWHGRPVRIEWMSSSAAPPVQGATAIQGDDGRARVLLHLGE